MTTESTPRIFCLTVLPDGAVGGGWGKANTVAIARVSAGIVDSVEIINVGWQALHDEGTEGGHHARIVRFLREHDVTDVATGHMGEGMRNTLTKLGVTLHLESQGAVSDVVARALA